MPQTDILLGDTIGEMGLYLRLTDIAFVGRSLTAKGGQNPLEPAMLRTAVLSGRSVQNFRESYQRLIKGGGAKLVRDREMLAGAVNYLLVNPKVREKMMDAAAGTVDDMRGALSRTLGCARPLPAAADRESPPGKAAGRASRWPVKPLPSGGTRPIGVHGRSTRRQRYMELLQPVG